MRWFRTKSKPPSSTIFGEYCATSSVHGVRYFSDPERTWCEKFWWIVMFFVSVVGCAMLIESSWQKWNLTPIVMNFENQPISVTDIPFPSVTICPPGKISKSLYDFDGEVREIEENGVYDNASDNFLAAVQLCQIMFKFSKHYDIALPRKRHSLSYALVVENVSVSMENFIGKCEFDDKDSLVYLLQYVMTDMGLCVNFNMLQKHRMLRKGSFPVNDPFIFLRGRYLRSGYDDNGRPINFKALAKVQNVTSDTTSTTHPRRFQRRFVSKTLNETNVWSPEGGYTTMDSRGRIPFRGLGVGRYTAFNLVLTGHKNDLSDTCDDSRPRGHRVVLHSPADYPQMINSVVIPFEHVTQLAVKPLVVRTSPELRRYLPEKRKCFFGDERYLKYFLIYTQNNCEIECLSNYTLDRCGCVKFNMMRSEQMKVCETNQFPCLHNAISEFVKIDNPLRRIYFGKAPKLNAFSYRSKCNCLPSCTTYQYDFELLKQGFQSGGNIDGISADFLGTLSIFFKEPQFIAMVRSELYGLTDFVANCGGLLGLFTGTSLLSLIEIAYFCFVRPWNRRKRRLSRVSDLSVPHSIAMCRNIFSN
ncbi:pickpocket protein 28-like [Aedes albopictus]|uniref:Pickpocket n=1 Tax=Aedes albopictus TaxID=7160 RepID=A0ABM1ZDE1_AEDAL